MRVSKTLISSAAAAAIVSVIGLAYAETSATGDTAQMQEQTRSDTSTQSMPADTSAAPTGTMQPSDTPTAPAPAPTGAADAGTATSTDNSTTNAMPAGSAMPSDSSAMPAATSSMPAMSGNAGAAAGDAMNQSNNGGNYNAGSNATSPADGSAATGGAPVDPSPMPAERPAKPDRN